jgi:hypothetical protein
MTVVGHSRASPKVARSDYDVLRGDSAGPLQFYGLKGRLLNPRWIIVMQRRGRVLMVGAISIASVVAGAALATWAKYNQSRTEVLEICAGALLIFGLGLLGFVLPHLS